MGSIPTKATKLKENKMTQDRVNLDRVLDKNDSLIYMFRRGGTYFGLDMQNVKEMHTFLSDIIEGDRESNQTTQTPKV